MACPILSSLLDAAVAVRALPSPSGLGSEAVLQEQVAMIASAVARLHADLALRMAALHREGSPVTDVRGEAVRAGVPEALAVRLRLLGIFAHEHPDVAAAWLAGDVSGDIVCALRNGASRLPTPDLRARLVELVLPQLPGLDLRRGRLLVSWTVDLLDPGSPDQDELSDHAARRLDWAEAPRGGIVLEGYLPPAEADAFKAAIEATAESLRTAGDGVIPSQRRADALATIVAAAATSGLPTGGGAPATMTVTVSLDEACRVALRDPAAFGSYEARPRSGATVGSHPAGDATVRFGLCCAAISPVLTDAPDAASLLHRIAGTGVLPLAVGRSVRLATPAQRTALRIRDGGCAIPGCGVAAPFTEPHHVTGWNLGGATDLDNLVSLCFVHHRLTELGRFTFVTRQPGQAQPAAALPHPRYWIIPPAA